nr:MAG TPA: hypothetical protein [Caudoviricetes sp.]
MLGRIEKLLFMMHYSSVCVLNFTIRNYSQLFRTPQNR